MTAFFNRVKVATNTSGVGTIALGQAATGYVSFSEAGVLTGSRVTYCIELTNGSFEIGRGVYTASNATLTRDRILLSKIAGQAASTSPISLSGSASVFLTAAASDLNNLGPAISVERHGARGDGTAVDTAAFLAAVAEAKVSQDTRTVYVPHRPNGYVLDGKISIPAGVIIRGDNVRGLRLSRIKPKAGYSGVLFDTEGYSTGRVLRPALIGLHLDGSSTTLTAVEVRCQEGLFKDLTITDCFTYGIHLGGFGSGASEQALNNHIVDNFIAGTIGVTEMFDALFVDYNSADNTINRNYIEAAKNSGIRSRGYNNKITNNHIYAVSGTGGGAGVGIYTETSADHDISQNYIELCAAEGVLMQGGGADVATLAAAIHGNVFRNVDTGNTSNGVIEIAGSDVSAVSVTGNVVRRDAATAYATPYFVYFNGITPTLQTVLGNAWQSGLITVGENNLPLELPGPVAAPINLRTARSVNFNSANSDTALPIALPFGYTRYRISSINISGASASLTTANFGLFTAAAGGGVAAIAAATAITVSATAEDTNNNMQTTAPATANTQSFDAANLFFRVGTAQGSPATATVTVSYSPVS